MKNTFAANLDLIYKIRTLLIAFILLLACNDITAQNNYGLKDIPVVNNLDSLVGLLPQETKNSTAYLKKLITIEYNRILFGSYKTGAYTNEIDSVSRLIHSPFGTAFYYYLAATVSNNYSPENTQRPIVLAETALKHFTDINDSFGIFSSNLLLARTQTGYLRYLNKRDSDSLNPKLRDSVKNNFGLLIQQYFSRAEKIAQTKHSAAFDIPLLYNQATLSSEIDNSTSATKAFLKKGIRLIQENPYYKYWQVAFYNLYGNTLVDEDSIRSAIPFHRMALESPINKESDFNYVLYNNLASNFEDLGITDSAVYFYKISLAQFEKSGQDDPNLEEMMQNQIAVNLEKSGLYREALQHKNKAYEILLQANDKAMLNAFEMQKEFKKTKEQELENQRLENSKKRTEQMILWVSLLSALLIAGIVLITRSNHKLKKANTEIKELQQVREKFYSIVAHDLRSPINSYQDMAGTVSFLLQQKDYEQIEKIAKHIDYTGIKLNNMLQNLLQWSLAQQNNLGYTPHPINIILLIEEFLPIYIQIARAKNITIITDFKYQKLLLTDPDYFATIVRNLLDNAIKNSLPNTSINLEITKQNNEVVFSITNSSAISAEKFTMIQELITSNKTIQAGEKGVGLGLALIKEFTTKIGGQLELTKENQVVSFKLKMPVLV